MSSGFQSNYNDSGYTVGNDWYDQNNTLVTTIPSRDIYATTSQVGVYMLDGTISNTTLWFPIFCSLSNLRNYGIPNDSDDAWIVFPGFGFKIYDNQNYAGDESRLYTNTSNNPVLFSFASGGFSNKGTNIYNINNNLFLYGKTHSIRIYFRGTEITINNLS